MKDLRRASVLGVKNRRRGVLLAENDKKFLNGQLTLNPMMSANEVETVIRNFLQCNADTETEQPPENSDPLGYGFYLWWYSQKFKILDAVKMYLELTRNSAIFFNIKMFFNAFLNNRL